MLYSQGLRLVPSISDVAKGDGWWEGGWSIYVCNDSGFNRTSKEYFRWKGNLDQGLDRLDLVSRPEGILYMCRNVVVTV